MAHDRIETNHQIMGGVPVIRGTRVPVATVVGLVAQGWTVDTIVEEYPSLNAADVRAALEFAAEAVMERQLPLTMPA